jgi:hypothetical protein
MNSNQFSLLLLTTVIGALVGAYNIHVTKRTETQKENLAWEIAIKQEKNASRDFLKSKRQESYGIYWAARSNWIAAYSAYSWIGQVCRANPAPQNSQLFYANQGILNDATNQLRSSSLKAMIVGSGAIARYLENELDIVNGVVIALSSAAQPGSDVTVMDEMYGSSFSRLGEMTLHSDDFVTLARRDLDATEV